MSTSQLANGTRTFRSGAYLDRLFRAAEHVDAQLQADICARIKQARVEAGFTQEEAADTLGITQRAYQNYEATRVPFRSMSRIAEVFGVPEAWLLRGDDALLRATDEQTLADVLRRLEELEAKVDRLPTKTQLQRGLDALREAIDAQASRGTGRGRRAGTDG